MEKSLNVTEQLKGKTILLYGGTGFLGKVWMSLVLAHFPDIEHIYMVVRSRKRSDGSIRQSSEQRLTEVATSGAFDPIREQHPKSAYMQFLNEKVTAIDGDVTNPFGGISDDMRDVLRGKVDILVNPSGVVDFNPPLDKSLDVNAFGMQNLVALAKDLGDIKFLHTSTCYVAGDRTGTVDEINPLSFPFPKADTLDIKHWDPDMEIKECMDMVTHAKRRAQDAFRQSDFLDVAKSNLKNKGEPTRGKALEKESSEWNASLSKINWSLKEQNGHNFGAGTTFTPTQSQSVSKSCVVRVSHLALCDQAVIESAVHFPKIGWNEGINTSAPLIYLINQGPLCWFPRPKNLCWM